MSDAAKAINNNEPEPDIIDLDDLTRIETRLRYLLSLPTYRVKAKYSHLFAYPILLRLTERIMELERQVAELRQQ